MSTTPRKATTLAAKLRSKDALVGLITKMPAPSNVELGGHLGFDFVIIDTEHGIAGGLELDHHLRAAEAAGVPVLVRIGTLDRPEIARALDGGAAGIVVPQVASEQEAREAVRLTHYPPGGTRGLATSTRAGHYGTVSTAEHLQNALKDTVVVVQVESRGGVENVEAILAVEGVSAVWIGLSDLSLELGHFGDFAHPEVKAAVDTVMVAAEAADVPLLVIADNDTDGAGWQARGAQGLLINLLTVLVRGLTQLKDHHTTVQQKGTDNGQ